MRYSDCAAPGWRSGGLIREIGDVERGAGRDETAPNQEHSVLEGRWVDLEIDSAAGIQIDLRSE